MLFPHIYKARKNTFELVGSVLKGDPREFMQKDDG